MSEPKALTQAQLEQAMVNLANWSIQANKLHAEFRFENFVEAFAFMTKVAFAAEAAQHHPEWSNTYNRVTINLTTHDAGDAITQKDIELARQITTLAN